jgi:ABC-2 type transport system ATP-binding protein
MTPAVEFAGVTKVYRRRFSDVQVEALRDVSFKVEPGEVCGFLGPNGAGKTTSINILMGFLFANSGTVRVLGYEPGDVEAKAQIGFLPENFAFHGHLTGPKLLALHLALSGRQVADPAGLIASLIHQVKLNGYEGLRISRYSRGMVQRLGIAQALLADPQLLIMDEPTSGLDPSGRKEVLDLVAGLKQAGKTVLLSSHILPEVEQICDRVVIVNRGRVAGAGRLEELLAGGGKVEVVVDALPEDVELAVAARGAIVRRSPDAIRLLVEPAQKREIVELLWGSGCDVTRMNPLKNSLEDLFLNLVELRGGIQ